MGYADSQKQKQYQREWYTRNRESVRKASADRRAKLREAVRQYKLDRGCHRCGYNACAAALDPHHPEGDGQAVTDRISRWCSRGFAWDKIKMALDSCEILCANCHRAEHWCS